MNPAFSLVERQGDGDVTFTIVANRCGGHPVLAMIGYEGSGLWCENMTPVDVMRYAMKRRLAALNEATDPSVRFGALTLGELGGVTA
jgi:hypothetical protein